MLYDRLVEEVADPGADQSKTQPVTQAKENEDNILPEGIIALIAAIVAISVVAIACITKFCTK